MQLKEPADRQTSQLAKHCDLLALPCYGRGKMAEPYGNTTVSGLNADYHNALAACGLIDGVVDIDALQPRPFRYAEGEFICRRGEVADCLWIIISGSVAIKEGDATYHVLRRNDVIGEQQIVGDVHHPMYDLVAGESTVEVLVVDKNKIEIHPEAATLWKNIAKIISKKMRATNQKASSLSRQLADDTHILHAYTNQYALSRRLSSGGNRQTEHRVDRAIIWFSDIVDFSDHTLALTPDQTAEVVQQFFNAQSSPIVARDGHIDKFIGDGLMAFWVLPDEQASAADECLEALRAAEEAVQAVSAIIVGSSRLGLRVGLHIGLVLSGDFGSAARHQFTLIGPEVNKAARLEQVRAEDVIDGSLNVGDIRLSAELRDELAESAKKKYNRRSVAQAKNIPKLVLYSASRARFHNRSMPTASLTL